MNTTGWIATGIAALGVTAGTLHFTNSAEQLDVRARMMAESERGVTSRSATLASRETLAERSVVVEFFTSQGCSSCPPSDRLAARLASEDGVLVIQRPVTYWDRLGWTDTLGKPENTDLQRSYARRGLGGRNGVYTPQAVVAGREGVVGSREAELRGMIGQARQHLARVTLENGEKGERTVRIEGAISKGATVHLVGLDRSETVKIGRGENGGRQVTSTNIWKGERPIGRMAGTDGEFAVAYTVIPGANAYAVVIREGASGPILGGRLLDS